MRRPQIRYPAPASISKLSSLHAPTSAEPCATEFSQMCGCMTEWHQCDCYLSPYISHRLDPIEGIGHGSDALQSSCNSKQHRLASFPASMPHAPAIGSTVVYQQVGISAFSAPVSPTYPRLGPIEWIQAQREYRVCLIGPSISCMPEPSHSHSTLYARCRPKRGVSISSTSSCP